MAKQQNGIGKLIGMEGKFTVPIRPVLSKKFRVRVRIKDAKQAFGRTDVLIEPLDGEGEAWVSKKHVET